MDFSLIAIIEAIILASALSLDSFVASFAYGNNKIKIPFLSVQVINTVCSSILGMSLLVGSIVRQYIPSWLTTSLCFTILFILGIVKLLDSITKSIIRKYSSVEREIKFSMLNFKFILQLYADPEDADVDQSKTISLAEAFSLAIALSLDGLAIGFGVAIGNINVLLVFIFSLFTGFIAIKLGCYIGNKFAKSLNFDLSWISGFILIILAFLKLF